MLLKYSNHNDILHTLGLIERQLKIFRNPFEVSFKKYHIHFAISTVLQYIAYDSIYLRESNQSKFSFLIP